MTDLDHTCREAVEGYMPRVQFNRFGSVDVPTSASTAPARRAADGSRATQSKQRENVPSQHEVRPGSTSPGIEQQCYTLGVTAGRDPHPIRKPDCQKPETCILGFTSALCWSCNNAVMRRKRENA